MKRSPVTMVALFLSAAMAAGQVYRTQTGRALDANYGVGSGGYNSVRQADRPIDGNLLINQQITGGFGFRGTVGYKGANELRLTLPSAQLDPFLQRSSGLGNLPGAVGGYGPQPYLSPNRTVLGVSGIATGYVRPGTSIPRSAYVPPEQARQLINAAVQPYRPLLAEVRQYRQINAALDPRSNAASMAGRIALRPEAMSAVAARPAASALFGVIGRKRAERLARELAGEEDSPFAPVEGRITSQLEGTQVPGDPLTGRPFKPGQAQPPGAPAQVGEPTRLLPPDEDVFIDILTLYNEMLRQEEIPPSKLDKKPEVKPEPAPFGPRGEEELEEQRRRELDRRSVERMRDQMHVRTLAGHGKDQLNRSMARAEKFLTAGKYYAAADEYQVAAILNPSNPLPHVGAALAQFAANEPLSAGVSLRQAMRRFPPLMEVRLDIKGMLGEAVLAQRIQRLEKRLAGEGDKAHPSLLFLATYLRHAGGGSDQAKVHAKALQAAAGEDKIYSAFAQVVLTGKAPSAKGS